MGLLSRISKAFTGNRIATMAEEDSAKLSPAAQAVLNKESRLLKRATELKKQKNLVEAIDCLKEAYDLAEKHQIGKPTDSLTRLANYLQMAGRLNEAWWEYHKVAGHGYCRWYATEQTRSYLQGDAFTRLGKMLLKEGYPEQALAYALGGYLAFQVHTHLKLNYAKVQGYDGIIKELSAIDPFDELQELLARHMKGASQRDIDSVRKAVTLHLKRIPSTQPKELIGEVYEILGCGDPAFVESPL